VADPLDVGAGLLAADGERGDQAIDRVALGVPDAGLGQLQLLERLVQSRGPADDL
jgi:hypothetical protein